MPNKCTSCGKLHPDDAKYLVDGCDVCGGKFFFFVKEEDIERAEKELQDLSTKEVKEIEEDVRYIIPQDVSPEETVVLDVEAIRVIKPGKYKIDVVNLFKQRPIIIRIGPGRYELDLTNLMPKLKKKKR
jgi:predicted  nucleic acid-binding Zn-ribbon protein